MATHTDYYEEVSSYNFNRTRCIRVIRLNSDGNSRYLYITQHPDGTVKTQQEFNSCLSKKCQGKPSVHWINNTYFLVNCDEIYEVYRNTEKIADLVSTKTDNEKIYIINPEFVRLDERYFIRPKPEESGYVHTLLVPYQNSDDDHYQMERIPIKPIPKTENLFESNSIRFYLTPKSTPFFEKMQLLSRRVLNSGGVTGAVFGGAVLSLIQHKFEYDQNPQVTFVPPKDIDIWMNYDKNDYGGGRFSRNSLERMFQRNIIPYLDENGYNHSWETVRTHGNNYGIKRLQIDSFEFDLCANVNNSCYFNELGDFTVTSLYFDVNSGIIGVRIPNSYNVETIIEHIKQKKLKPFMNYPRLAQLIKRSGEYDIYLRRSTEREKKMLGKGFTYDDDTIPLTKEFVMMLPEQEVMDEY